MKPRCTIQKTLQQLVELLDIEKSINVQVRKLSLGQRMKCELIAALLHSPKVLFLDEPTIGLDVVMQKPFVIFISEYNQVFGATIILTSHYMGDVKELCKRTIIIDSGKKVFDGPPKISLPSTLATRFCLWFFGTCYQKGPTRIWRSHQL